MKRLLSRLSVPKIGQKVHQVSSAKKSLLSSQGWQALSQKFTPLARDYSSFNDKIDINTQNFNPTDENITYEPQIGVSKMYKEITNDKIEDFLSRNKITYKMRPTGAFVVKECPFCHKPHHNKPSNLWTLNLKENSGAFLCFRCGTHGSWYDFVRYIMGDSINFDNNSGAQGVVSKNAYTQAEIHERENKTAMVVEENVRLYDNMLEAVEVLEKLGETEEPTIEDVGDLSILESLRYLTGTETPEQRHLSVDTLKAYKIGLGVELFRNEEGGFTRVPIINYPLFKPTARKGKTQMNLNKIDTVKYDCVRAKVRGAGKEYKHFQRFKPQGGIFGVFGLNLLKPDSKIVVITEGEFDAMAVYEATGLPAVSLPNGASSMPAQLISYLEKVERVYLWMDNDETGQLNVEAFSQKLGTKRTYIVQTSADIKDANDALRKDPELIRQYISKAGTILSKNLIKFENIRDQVKSRIENKDLNCGVKSLFFPWFNRVLKGFRRGEFNIFTGPTGSGKTTFLSQLSLDFAMRGVPTLWCSFELKNEILVTTMLNQFSGLNLEKEIHRFDYFADQFEKVPLYFQTYFGSTHIDDVLTMVDYAIYTHDVGHIVIDNLQFMLSGQGRGIERFEMQDDVIARLRNLATTRNVSITLVIHPRKGEEGQDLTVSSIFGTAKSTQEADNVMILQQREKYRVIDIKKNRHDGEIGKSSLWFDKASKRFEQISAKEIEELLGGAKIETIMEHRSRQLKEAATDMAENLFGEESGDDVNEEEIHLKEKSEPAHPQSNSTEEYLQEQLEVLHKKHIPKKKPHYLKNAFSKLEKLKNSLLEKMEENEPKENSDNIPDDLKASFMEQLQRQTVRDDERRETRVKIEDVQQARAASPAFEEDLMDQFDVQVEESASTEPGSSNKSESTSDTTSILQGLHRPKSGESVPTSQVKNFYEGESVLFTYDDMVEELVDKKPKYGQRRPLDPEDPHRTIKYQRGPSKNPAEWAKKKAAKSDKNPLNGIYEKDFRNHDQSSEDDK